MCDKPERDRINRRWEVLYSQSDNTLSNTSGPLDVLVSYKRNYQPRLSGRKTVNKRVVLDVLVSYKDTIYLGSQAGR